MKRWPLFVAIAYAVVVIIALVVVPAAPEATASGARLVGYYQEHGGGVRIAMWLSAWSMVPLVVLIAHRASAFSPRGDGP